LRRGKENRKKPVERQRKAGNPGHRPLPHPVAILPAPEGPPDPPEGLSKSARGLWATIWSDGSAWLGPTDAILVRLLVEAVQERDELLEQVSATGRTYRTKTGMIRPHPLIAQVREIERAIVAMASLLGFTPTDRARLGIAEVKRVSHLQDLLARRRAYLGSED